MITTFEQHKTFYNALEQKMKDLKSDWNQNDPNALDYIKNRTHYSEIEKKVFVEEQTISGFFVMQEPIYAVVDLFSFTPVVGETYTVTWDGESYDCTAYDAEGMVCLGNENYVRMMSGGDIPFAIICAGGVFVATESTADSHTISIYGYDETVHQIDEKYIPDTISRTADVETALSSKAEAEHAHEIADVTDLQTTLDGKANSVHAHEISDVNGLQTALDSKANSTDIVQSDWSQNDESAADYVKGRTHWVETTETVIIDNQSYTTADLFGAGIAAIMLSTDIMLVDGSTYIITINNVEYSSTCRNYVGGGVDGLVVGNPELMGLPSDNIDTDCPFLLAKGEYGTVGLIATLVISPAVVSVGDTITLSITGMIEEVYQIDKKYLPDMIGIKGTVRTAEIFNDYGSNTASGDYSHAEGQGTTASGDYSHAEGYHTTASGEYSHAEGMGSKSSERSSHAEGFNTDASGVYQHVQGKYNIEDTADKYAHIVGNGTADDTRSNAHTLDWSGNAWFAGEIKVGGTGQDDATAKVVPSIQTATVGQVISVKTVDANGKPTEWEAVSMLPTVDDSGVLIF